MSEQESKSYDPYPIRGRRYTATNLLPIKCRKFLVNFKGAN